MNDTVLYYASMAVLGAYFAVGGLHSLATSGFAIVPVLGAVAGLGMVLASAYAVRNRATYAERTPGRWTVRVVGVAALLVAVSTALRLVG